MQPPRTIPSAQSSVAEVEPRRQSDQPPRINMNQLSNTDGSASMFECPLCTGVAWLPKVTMCCQKVFCGNCLDNLMHSSSGCPHCHTSLVVSDGSTGGCSDQRVKRLDRTSTGVQAVLWRVYGNLRIQCVHECGWSGNIQSYVEHLSACRIEQSRIVHTPASHRQPPQAPLRPAQAPKQVAGPPPIAAAPDHVDGVPPVGPVEVVWEHLATDDSQLTLKVGDRVQVKQHAAHGWVYGHRQQGSQGGPREGWFPSFCLPEHKPTPKPRQSPPPSSPPAGSTQVAKDYEASDPAQLSVKEGELVYVRQRDTSGWTFVVRVSPQGTVKREGWVPDWLLQAESTTS